jgi:hypothetical protein
MDVNSVDGGILKCTASIEGCSIAQSHNNCHQEVFNESSFTALSILSKLYTVCKVVFLGGLLFEVKKTACAMPPPPRVFHSCQTLSHS